MESYKNVSLKKPFDAGNIKIKKDQFFSNAYTIELPLDSEPDHVWHAFFEREWKSSRDIWDRKVVVLGSKMLLITPPDDIELKLDWLDKIIKETNRKFREFREAERDKKAREVLKTSVNETAIEKIREAIRRVSPA